MRTAVTSERKLSADIFLATKYTVVLFFFPPTAIYLSQTFVITIYAPILSQSTFSSQRLELLARTIPPSPNFYF